MLNTYEDFSSFLHNIGFMPLSANRADFPNLSGLTAEEAWHTNDPGDPWQWRRRIADEKMAAYGKFFEKKPTFITIEWLPDFIAVRRRGHSVASLYQDGLLSTTAKDIYALFDEHKQVAAHDLRPLLGLGKDSKTSIDNACLELQMGLFVTVSDMVRKIGTDGEPYGWPSVCLMRMEDWAPEACAAAAKIGPAEASNRIMRRAKEVMPEAEERTIKKLLGLPS